MRFRPQSLILVVPVFLSLVLLTACGPGAEDEPDGTPTPRPTPDDATAIRDVELSSVPAMQTLLQQLGSGRVDVEGVVYADLTGDQREEAVVPVTSDGTLGNIAFAVYSMNSGSPELILTRTLDRTTAGGIVMDVEGGVLTESVGIFGPEDPFCCPSEMRYTTFRWDGDELQVEREVAEKQTPGPKQ